MFYDFKNSGRIRGFTFIELLVAVAVIAMFLSFAVTSLSGARVKSRDSKREEDIKTIQNALNLYVVNMGFYPICEQIVIDGKSDCLSGELITEGSAVALPTDPFKGSRGTCGGSGDYVYCYTSLDGLRYTLQYALESDSVLGKSPGWQIITIEH